MDVLNHLLWLKVHLVGRTWRNVSGSLLALVGMFLAAGSAVSLGGYLLLGILECGPDLGRVLLGGSLGGLYLGWILAPVFGYRLNESLDPTVFGHLPVPSSWLILGIYLGNFLDPVVLVSAPLLLGGWVAGAMLGGSWLWGGIGAVLLLFHAMGTAQLVHSWSLALLRRRGAGEVLFVAFAMLLLGSLVALEVGVLSPETGGQLRTLVQIAEDWRWVDRLVCFSPPGLCMEAMMPAGPATVFGAPLACLLLAAVSALSVWVAGWTSSRLLSGGGLGPARETARKTPRQDRLVALLRVLTGSSMLAGRAAVECRLVLREPQYLLLFLSYPIAYSGGCYWISHASGLESSAQAVLVGVIVLSSLFLFTGVLFNSLAVERSGLRLVFSGPVDPLVYLVGKNLGMWLLLSGVYAAVVVSACLSASLPGKTMGIFLVAGQVSIVILLGLGNVGSTLAPIPLPERGGGARSSASFGRVFRVMLVNSLGMTLGATASGLCWVLILGVPLTTEKPQISLLLGLLGLGCVMGIYCLGTWIGASFLKWRREALLELLAK
jgi:hypothetical protein